jgi:hypothetical protein
MIWDIEQLHYQEQKSHGKSCKHFFLVAVSKQSTIDEP